MVWLFISVVLTVYDHLTLRSMFSLGSSILYDFNVHLVINLLGGLVGALTGGFLMVFVINELFRDKPYIYSIVAVSVTFIFVMLAILLLITVYFTLSNVGQPLSAPDSMAFIIDFLGNPEHIKHIMIWGLVTAATQLTLRVNDKFGPGLFWSIATGKYHTPKQERRVFMFIDINGSTGIAEQIGNQQYYQLLRDFFADITNPILYNQGQIYQYVGDEAVISWDLEEGIKENQCLHCYFDIQQLIDKRSAYYQAKYGLVPTFKAGLHYGDITAGEVGIMKRDITFSGDVMNTTARIMSQCHHYQVNLLASSELLGLLDLGEQYIQRLVGEISLRGRKQKVGLSTVLLPG